jgi:hypothetical protein
MEQVICFQLVLPFDAVFYGNRRVSPYCILLNKVKRITVTTRSIVPEAATITSGQFGSMIQVFLIHLV